MTSSPLFIIVAESMVIFGPIFQVGCASASSTVIAPNVSRSRCRRVRPMPSGRCRAPLRAAAPQRLVDRAVLGVDREDLGAALRAAR